MLHAPDRGTRARSLLAVGVAGTLVFVSACGFKETAESSGNGSGEFPRTVEHFRGTTEIESPPETIVALNSSYVDAAVALELDVVGRVVSEGGEELPGYRGEALPEYLGEEGQTYAGDAEVVELTEDPDLTKIAELEPDLIISADVVGHNASTQQFSEIAPTVISDTIDTDWKDNIRLLAEATGKEDLAEEKIGAYEERAATLGDAIAEEYNGEVPTLSVTRFGKESSVDHYSNVSFPGIVQQDVGLPSGEGVPNSSEETWLSLREEETLDVDADHIVTGIRDDGNSESEETAEEFRSNPLWEQLEGEQHEVSDQVWFNSASLQGADGILDDLSEIYGVDG